MQVLEKFGAGTLRAVCAGLALLAISACTADSEDPLEPINRPIHALNKGVDGVVLRPASEIYGAFVPPPFQNGVRNFAVNLGNPGQFVNYVLQGDLDNAAYTFARFALNSTIGLGGLFDIAARDGNVDRPTDFGQTLHKWGVNSGPYVELPVLGPSTARDAVGILADALISPTSRISDEARRISLAATGLEIIDLRHRFRGVIDALLYESADSYSASRNAYLQNRRRALGGELELDDLEDPYAFDE